jgi:hypothetical protein
VAGLRPFASVEVDQDRFRLELSQPLRRTAVYWAQVPAPADRLLLERGA